MQIFTSGTPELCSSLREKLNAHTAQFEYNFQQIIALAKLKQLDKLCIYMDVWNVSGKSFNGMRGQGAAELIHEIDPNIPILIWDGREFDTDPEILIPPAFQVNGEVHPIINDNELYLSFDHYDESKIHEITAKFFEGTLNFEDIPNRDCLTFKL
jgi:hypothetical protein